ncbi:MAG: response regulator [Moraxellaceae bacterium]|nr:MAG: response regulator [Moraxellaceae bacterium]
MDEYQLAKEIRKVDSLSSATLIALMGYGQKHDRLSALEAGFDFHIV